MRLLPTLAFLTACAGTITSPTAPPSLDGDPLYHFDRVDAHLYRSSQPTTADLERLHDRYHICRVIQLDSGWEAKKDNALGVETVRIELSVLSTPSHDVLNAIAHWIDDSPCPVLVHCFSGQDRTGLVVALYRVRHHELSAGEAFSEAWRHHFHPYDALMRAWIREVGW